MKKETKGDLTSKETAKGTTNGMEAGKTESGTAGRCPDGKGKQCKNAKGILPGGNPTSAGHADEVSDPPVPNRAHTEM